MGKSGVFINGAHFGFVINHVKKNSPPIAYFKVWNFWMCHGISPEVFLIDTFYLILIGCPPDLATYINMEKFPVQMDECIGARTVHRTCWHSISVLWFNMSVWKLMSYIPSIMWNTFHNGPRTAFVRYQILYEIHFIMNHALLVVHRFIKPWLGRIMQRRMFLI